MTRYTPEQMEQAAGGYEFGEDADICEMLLQGAQDARALAEKDAQIAMLAKAAPQAAELLIELRDKEAQIAALLDVFQHEQAAYEESQRAHALAGKRKSSDECGAIAAALRFAAEEVSKRIASWRETPAPPQEPTKETTT